MGRMKINLKCCWLAFAIFAWSGSATADVAQSREWKSLLHFRRDLRGVEKSEIDNPSFFLSPDGNVNPLSELNASVKAFGLPPETKVGPYDQHPQCVYPARYAYLKSKLGLGMPSVACAEFERWRSGVNAHAVKLVYAAPYLGNPASMFGHTFLRLSSGGSEILDAGLSFDAAPSQDGYLLFALKGLTGGYQGGFSQQPYYTKIENYSDRENRDLWEFELNFDQAEIERLLQHIWEMGSARFDYYFFEENCSYHLLSLLEVAKPEWKLRDRFHAMAVPIDTVRSVVESPGAVRSSRVRPSLFSRLEERIAKLTDGDRKRFDEIRAEHSKLGTGEKAEVLDALLDWEKYRPSKFAEKLLLTRAQLPPAVPEIEDRAVLSLGHKTSKQRLSVASENCAARIGVGLRPVLHDELETSAGYVSSSSLTILDTNLSYFPGFGKVALDELTFASVVSRPSMDSLHQPTSWTVNVGLERPRETRCLDCLAGALRAGLGATVGLFEERMRFSLMGFGQAELSNEFSKTFDQSFRFGPSLEFMTIVSFNDRLKLRIGAERLFYFAKFDGASIAFWKTSATFAAAVANDLEFRVDLEARAIDKGVDTDLGLTVSRYF